MIPRRAAGALLSRRAPKVADIGSGAWAAGDGHPRLIQRAEAKLAKRAKPQTHGSRLLPVDNA
jgi:hypothetical protein